MPEKIDHYFLSLEEPYSSCLLFLRGFILACSPHITEERKFNTPFYYYNQKWLGFISYDPKSKEIYIAFARGALIDHPALVSEGRKKQKIMRIDPSTDMDIESLNDVLRLACALY